MGYCSCPGPIDMFQNKGEVQGGVVPVSTSHSRRGAPLIALTVKGTNIIKLPLQTIGEYLNNMTKTTEC